MRNMQYTVEIQNFKIWVTTFLTLFLTLHCFALVWIYIGLVEDGWLNRRKNPEHAELLGNIYDQTF